MLFGCLLCGVILGFLYDFLRMTRMWISTELPPKAKILKAKLILPRRFRLFPNRVHKPKQIKRAKTIEFILIFLEDIFFCLLCALSVILLLYQTNDGQLRLSAIALLIIGFALYLVTIGKWMRFLSSTLTVLLAAVFTWAIAILAYPIVVAMRRCWRWISLFFYFVQRKIKNSIKGIMTRIKGQLELRKAMKAAREISQQSLNEILPTVIKRKRKPNGPYNFSSGARKRS